jgi:hypothetical protein
MSWSYSQDPSSSQLDACRFWLQDTDEARQLISDEELQFVIDAWAPIKDSPLYAASVAAEVLAARFAALPDVSADGISVSLGQLQEKYNALAGSLRDQYKAQFETGAGPTDEDVIGAGGYDPTIPPLNFGTGFQDNFEAGLQDYGDRGNNGAGYPPYDGWVEEAV